MFLPTPTFFPFVHLFHPCSSTHYLDSLPLPPCSICPLPIYLSIYLCSFSLSSVFLFPAIPSSISTSSSSENSIFWLFFLYILNPDTGLQPKIMSIPLASVRSFIKEIFTIEKLFINHRIKSFPSYHYLVFRCKQLLLL